LRKPRTSIAAFGCTDATWIVGRPRHLAAERELSRRPREARGNPNRWPSCLSALEVYSGEVSRSNQQPARNGDRATAARTAARAAMEKVGYDTLIGVAGAVVDGPAGAPKWGEGRASRQADGRNTVTSRRALARARYW